MSPMPNPRPKEDRNNFISRCMSDKTMQKEYKKQERRQAVCFSQWKESKKKSK